MTAQEMNKYVGARIRARRKSLKMTVDQFAAQLGTCYMGACYYEIGRNGVSLARLYQIAEVLQCQPSDFLPPFPATPTNPADLDEI